MDKTQVIIRPLVTEKTTHRQTTRNEYAFEVTATANKPEIRKAVERIYKVKVVDVRTMNRKGKPRRNRYGLTYTADWKRAVVVLDEDSRIDLF